MLSSSDIRQSFIDYFVQKKHEVVPSAPLVPINDPSLLFTNAGMNQFKDIFLGTGSRDYTRAVDSQKCLRAGGKHNDLEEVGKDEYHHTFFEMLGNWSFGDYYKKEAIQWAWELVTSIWKIPKGKLYATVHYEDDESFELWKEITDIKPEHVLKFGDKDNFWEMADTGPCGPCSEIHYDRGIQHCSHKDDPKHVCELNGDCGRFVEIWNLVFIQFNRLENGELIDLPKKHVDTGAGFERLVAILQGVASNYETDLFMPIIKKIEKISKTKFENEKHAFRVISDHIRALTFAIGDGVIPSNLGRGYVIRRILRRATRFGRTINIHKPFLAELVDAVCEIMGHHYPEIIEKKMHIKMAINAEEERFNQTLDMGIMKFNEIVQNLGTSSVISGKDAFTLYDTYGFPLDLTELMAEEKGLEVDKKGFEKEMEAQKYRARKDAKFDTEKQGIIKLEVPAEHKSTFVGYETETSQAMIEHFYVDKENNAIIVLDKTPFYAESGGQVADTGRIYNDEFDVMIEDVQKQNEVIFHFGTLNKGKVSQAKVNAEVDIQRRKNIARNHTATHLLHAALRNVLGTHLHQKGSLVAPDHLRFDFTHFHQVTHEELNRVERMVNEMIISNTPVYPYHDDLDAARKKGAMALFGEKYDKKVRVIEIGDSSLELCGGIHCQRTGEIGLFKILSESSIAAGVRRIEAITGMYAYENMKKQDALLHTVQTVMQTSSEHVIDKIKKLLDENKLFRKELEKSEIASLKDKIENFIMNKTTINGVALVGGIIKVKDNHQLREIADLLKNRIGSGIGLLAARIEDKVSLICVVTPDLTKRFHAGKIVNKAAEVIGGRGGGKPYMAMAGGKDLDKLPELYNTFPEIIRKIVS
ncbi:MAG TPA: alanine--tRNA ligase [Candidatus Cloacimonetes bacterium]|nr:alanine--tRNA ligase [Candidatus Cloacimonadota bacterium]HEX37708.1 alanine--tRNA ligase [Candidatus Cloacimonadota bacterium]